MERRGRRRVLTRSRNMKTHPRKRVETRFRGCSFLIASKATPGCAGGLGELPARGEVDKEKTPC